VKVSPALLLLKLAAIIAFISAITYCWTNNAWLLLLASYLYYRVLSVVANGISLHRYFSHRSFATSKPKHIFLCWVSVLVGEADPILSSLIHRHHHKYSDTDRDIHSPTQGFWQSAFTWPFNSAAWFASKRISINQVKDLLQDPHVKFVATHYFRIWASIIVVGMLISWQFCVFFILMPVFWELTNNGVFSKYLVHTKLPGSYRNYETLDTSYNHKFLLWVYTAEIFHNNHHKFPGAYDQATEAGEFDPSAWVINKFFKESINTYEF